MFRAELPVNHRKSVQAPRQKNWAKQGPPEEGLTGSMSASSSTVFSDCLKSSDSRSGNRMGHDLSCSGMRKKHPLKVASKFWERKGLDDNYPPGN